MSNPGFGNRKLYVLFAVAANAWHNCEDELNKKNLDEATTKLREEWLWRWRDRCSTLVEKYLPSGSGFDSGTSFIIEDSNSDKLVFTTAYHHMNSYGFYDGWTEHKITVTPDFATNFNINVSGRNRNDIKEYIAEMFSNILSNEADFPTDDEL